MESTRETESQLPFQLTWLGHASFLLSWNQTHILVDPNFSQQCGLLKRLSPAPGFQPSTSIDAVVLTHAHLDHWDPASLAQLFPARIFFAKGLHLDAAGAHPVLPGESVQVGELTLHFFAARHGGNRFHPFHAKVPALCFVVESQGQAIFFAGDGGFSPVFAQVRDQFHPSLGVFGVGGYAPEFLLGTHHLNPESVIQVARDMNLKWVVPGHIGTFPMAYEDPHEGLHRFAQVAAIQGQNWFIPFPAQ
ncbi:MAG: MBL fold metallo-hydrolase [Acidobacteria bacterium]|nr:MBL fold metallo-hydrolase [Acidobacteriota bacterium]